MCNVPDCGNGGQNVLPVEGRQVESTVDDNFPVRLRAERKRLRLTQKALADIGGVGLGAQHRYEAGGSLPDVDYLLRIGAEGVDWYWVLTGRRAGRVLGRNSSDLLEAFSDLQPLDQLVILRLTYSLAGRELPPQPKLSGGELEEAILHFLRVSPTEHVDELARELATSLPTILQASGGVYAPLAREFDGTAAATEQDDDAAAPIGRRAGRN